MTPQDKAIKLVDKYIQTNGNSFFAKECALICVDEIMKSRPAIPSPNACDNITDSFIQATEYWQEVKTEIEKL